MKTKNFTISYLILSLVALVSAHGGDSDSLGAMHNSFGWFGMMGFTGFIFMGILIITLIVFTIWIIKQIQDGGKKNR